MEQFILITSDSAPILVYVGIFTVLLLCGLGLPVPEETVLIAGGYLASSGTIGIYPALGVCFAGVIAGDFLLFTAGSRWGSAGLASWYLKSALSPRRRVRIRRYFRRHGDKTIFAARFISGFRVAAFLTAGMAKMKPRTFLAWDILAALISVPLFFLLGYFLHDQRGVVIGALRNVQRGLLLLAVGSRPGGGAPLSPPEAPRVPGGRRLNAVASPAELYINGYAGRRRGGRRAWCGGDPAGWIGQEGRMRWLSKS